MADVLLDEGCGGKITPLEGGWVRKTIKRKRSKSRNSAEVQFQLQTWAATHLTEANGYKALFSPTTRATLAPNSYEMRRIESGSWPWILSTLEALNEQIDAAADVTEERKKLYREEAARFRAAFAAGTGYELWDNEFFVQSDGRVAVVDFDQCRRL